MRSVRNRVGVALVALVGLLGVLYAYSWFQTNGLQGDLASAHSQSLILQSRMSSYAPLQAAQSETQQLQSLVAQAMVGDLQWKPLIDKFNASAPNGVRITSLSGLISSPTAAATASANPLTAPGVSTIGTITIAGTAPDSTAVGKFVNALTLVPGLTDPVPTSIAGGKGAYQFSVTVGVTTAALGGRYASSTPTPSVAPSSTPGGS